MKQFCSQLQQVIDVDQEFVRRFEFNRFLSVELKKFYEKISETMFAELNKGWAKSSFLDISIVRN